MSNNADAFRNFQFTAIVFNKYLCVVTIRVVIDIYTERIT